MKVSRKQGYDLNAVEFVNGKNGHVNPAFSIELENTSSDVQQNGSTPGGDGSSRVVSLPSDTEQKEERENWDSPLEFLLSCIAMSVGLGNVYRFPFTAYKNGGGAFLIPYIIILTLIGRPMYLLEMSIGQFSSSGQFKVWKLNPFFKGVGLGSAIGTICVVSYYCSLMAFTVFYFCASFQAKLPWTKCNDDWSVGGYECYDENSSLVLNTNTRKNESIPSVYFNYEVLKRNDDIDNGIGSPDWRLALCLLFSWAFICLTMIKGVKSSGKVAYFTALFPYLVLLILLIRGLTLEGAWDGIKYLFNPEWEKILEPGVWAAAVGQCFFSLSTGFGPIIMFSSYNKFSHNIHRDAMIVSYMDTGTSILAGCCIFSVLGNLAFRTGVPLNELADGGPALAFISYPDAIASFDIVPQLFSVLFFLMLFTLGVGSATSLTGGVITVISDQLEGRVDKRWVTISVCSALFFSGLIYICPGGQKMTTLVDYFGADTVIYIMSILEISGIAWFYGLNNIHRDIEFMLTRDVSKHIWWVYWKLCWGIIIPIGLTIILVYSLAVSQGLQGFPTIAIVFGWLILAVALLPFPICAIHSVLTRNSPTLKQKFLDSFKPTSGWGPKNLATRKEWLNYPNKAPTMTHYIQKTKGLFKRTKHSLDSRGVTIDS